MSRIICGTLLLVASVLSAQPQRDPSHPPYATPPTFPESKQPSAPDQGKAATTEQSRESAQVAKQIRQAFDNEPLLKDSDLKVAVDDTKVTLMGTVTSEKEREIALSAAALYAGKREIVDQIKLKT